MKMKLILLATLVSLALASILPPPDGNRIMATDPMVELDEEQFEIEFGLEPITDPVEKERRQKALEKAEKDEKEQNEKFLKKKSDFFERLNEWSDLPEDEFKQKRTGSKEKFSRGLLMPKIKPVDARSEKYFASLLLRRESVPASYSAVDADLVSSVKNQLNCGSCVAFGLHLTIIFTILILVWNIWNILNI